VPRVRRALVVAAAIAAALWIAPGAFARTSAWCGSGETTTDRTDIVTGRQIHAVVVVPSDAPDTFTVGADELQTDVDSVNAWWLGQDATRRPRFDLAPFGVSTCLDIGFVRLAETAASFTSADAAFQAIGSEVEAAGFTNPFKKYLVYYAGPSVETDVCGVGGGDFDGPGLSIVIPAGCPTVPTDTVLAHELLHALGAVPPGDPNACPNDPGHPCDSPTDVLYPFTHGEPLSEKVLDFNHDDYYAHSGTWPDIQDSGWLSHLDTPQVAFTITFAGSGTVDSDVPGIACTATCTTQWDQASTFSLNAEAPPGKRFVGWRGDCHGVGSCFVSLGTAQATTALFGPVTIPVKVAVKGKGRVACTPLCSRTFRAGTPLTLRAVAAKGWRFVRWRGACQGTRRVCRPSTDFALSVRASFARISRG
jgi:hypothetical protein